jgi:hypothetical protein
MMLQDVQAQLTESFRNLVDGAIAAFPQLLVGAVFLVLAFLVAKVVERLLRALMSRLHFNALVRKSGVDSWLSRMGFQRSLDSVVPRVVYYILLFLFAREGASALGLTAISDAIGSLISYLPNLISAFLVLIVGSVVAQVAGKAVAEAGRGAGVEFAPFLGRLLTGVLLFVLVVMALGELEVQTLLVREFALILVAGGALSFALSFGLGSRDISRNILAGMYIRKIIQVGDEIEVEGRRGRVEGITSTQTILRDEERSYMVSNSVFLDSITSF